AAIGGPTLAHFRAVVCSMEPPCTSFHLKNGLKVGLPLIHPEFCNWLYAYGYLHQGYVYLQAEALAPSGFET
ncbi:MAG: hypothetical protein Q9M31_09540, partial [Mariprofundus sp.]|nr:hypothetical protein [Mariprofundus sp.]